MSQTQPLTVWLLKCGRSCLWTSGTLHPLLFLKLVWKHTFFPWLFTQCELSSVLNFLPFVCTFSDLFFYSSSVILFTFLYNTLVRYYAVFIVLQQKKWNLKKSESESWLLKHAKFTSELTRTKTHNHMGSRHQGQFESLDLQEIQQFLIDMWPPMKLFITTSSCKTLPWNLWTV